MSLPARPQRQTIARVVSETATDTLVGTSLGATQLQQHNSQSARAMKTQQKTLSCKNTNTHRHAFAVSRHVIILFEKFKKCFPFFQKCEDLKKTCYSCCCVGTCVSLFAHVRACVHVCVPSRMVFSCKNKQSKPPRTLELSSCTRLSCGRQQANLTTPNVPSVTSQSDL